MNSSSLKQIQTEFFRKKWAYTFGMGVDYGKLFDKLYPDGVVKDLEMIDYPTFLKNVGNIKLDGTSYPIDYDEIWHKLYNISGGKRKSRRNNKKKRKSRKKTNSRLRNKKVKTSSCRK